MGGNGYWSKESFETELVTREQFLRKLNKSTITCDIALIREYGEEQGSKKERNGKGESILKPRERKNILKPR